MLSLIVFQSFKTVEPTQTSNHRHLVQSHIWRKTFHDQKAQYCKDDGTPQTNQIFHEIHVKTQVVVFEKISKVVIKS
jgi:hypothetical protein